MSKDSILKRFKNPFLLALVSFPVIFLVLICITSIFSGSGTADKLLPLFVLSTGLAIMAAGITHIFDLQNRGIEQLNKKERKQITKAYMRYAKPESKSLDSQYFSYIHEQSKLATQYIILGFVFSVGFIFTSYGLHLASPPEDVYDLRYRITMTIFYAIFFPLITVFKIIKKIQTYIENDGFPDERIEIHKNDDDRWWTGKW